MAKSVAGAAKAAKDVVESVAEAAVTPVAPVSIASTATNLNVKFNKQAVVLVAGTALTTVGVIKLLELRKTRKETVLPEDLND